MAPLIHLAVIGNRLFPVTLRRDHRLGATLVQLRPQLVVVESLVAEKSGECQALKQPRNTFAIMPLTRQQDEIDQIAQCIDESEDLRCQAAARAPNSLMLSPPFAPVAF
jgi:hypothetical protein